MKITSYPVQWLRRTSKHTVIVSVGITYVTVSWATADCERAVLGPRNSAVDISREVLQLLLDVKEYSNQWVQLRMFAKHCDVIDRA